MGTTAFTSAGSFISICLTAPTTFDAAGYAALAWKEVGEVTEIPEFGKKFAKIEHKPLKSRKTKKFKGSYDTGALTLPMARAKDDLGQVDMLTARDSDDEAYFRVTYGDGSVEYFPAMVMSYVSNIGGVDGITMASAEIEITDEIIEGV